MNTNVLVSNPLIEETLDQLATLVAMDPNVVDIIDGLKWFFGEDHDTEIIGWLTSPSDLLNGNIPMQLLLTGNVKPVMNAMVSITNNW